MTGGGREWTLLSSHGQVLLAVAGNRQARVDDLAERVGLSRRSVLSVLRDLEVEGYIRRSHFGRRTTYVLAPDRPMRHPASAHHEVGELLSLLADPWRGSSEPGVE